ncbi:hypothetical protein FOZ63_014119, partial [Perkinsus olseni]
VNLEGPSPTSTSGRRRRPWQRKAVGTEVVKGDFKANLAERPSPAIMMALREEREAGCDLSMCLTRRQEGGMKSHQSRSRKALKAVDLGRSATRYPGIEGVSGEE